MSLLRTPHAQGPRETRTTSPKGWAQSTFRGCPLGMNSGRKGSCPRTQQHHQSPGGLQHQLQKSWEIPRFPNQLHSAGDKKWGSLSLPSHSRSHISTVMAMGALGGSSSQDGARASTGRALGGSSKGHLWPFRAEEKPESPEPPSSDGAAASPPCPASQPAPAGIEGEKRSKAQCHAKSRSLASSSSFCATSKARSSSVG